MKSSLHTLTLGLSLALSGLSANSTLAQNLASQSHPSIVTSASDSGKITANLQAALNYAAFWNTGERHYADAALADNFTDRNLPVGRVQGKAGALQASANFRAAVPDLRANIEEILISGEQIILRLRFTGHFSGKLGTTQGRGQTIDFAAVDIYRIANGKISDNWHLEDMHQFFQQIQ